MIIIENTNLRATLQITDIENNLKSVMSINANLAKGGSNLNFNFTVMDEVAMLANLEATQTEMDNFKIALNEKMVEFGYSVKI